MAAELSRILRKRKIQFSPGRFLLELLIRREMTRPTAHPRCYRRVEQLEVEVLRSSTSLRSPARNVLSPMSPMKPTHALIVPLQHF